MYRASFRRKSSAVSLCKLIESRVRISIFLLSPGNRLLRIEQSGVASSTKVPPSLKQRESVKLKGRVKKGKQEPRDHHQTQHSPNSLAELYYQPTV